MTERDAFLQQILAHPDDDAPRLVFADWLEEHGEPERAEFIRLQAELAQTARWLPGPPIGAGDAAREGVLNPRWEALDRREQQLIEWATGAEAPWWPPGVPRRDSRFRRGFVESLSCRAAEWLGAADAVLAATPLRELQLADWAEHLPELVSRDYGTVRELRLEQDGGELPMVIRVTKTTPTVAAGLGEMARTMAAAGLDRLATGLGQVLGRLGLGPGNGIGLVVDALRGHLGLPRPGQEGARPGRPPRRRRR